MVDVIKRRITGVSDDSPADGQVEIDMANISPASFSTPLNATTTVSAPSPPLSRLSIPARIKWLFTMRMVILSPAAL